MLLLEYLTEIVLMILFLFILAIGILVGVAITRRQKRERFFQRLDEVRGENGPVITRVLTERIPPLEGVEILHGITGIDRMYLLEQLCLEKKPTPEQMPRLRELCEGLGLVGLWQKRLSGEIDLTSLRDALGRPEGVFQYLRGLQFLMRAKAAENLGAILHQASWPLLIRALDDPHPDVQTVALRALAAVGEPQSFSALVERLHALVVGPGSRLSLRSVKSALVGFPLGQAVELLPSLHHPHRRIRFLATDTIREMVEREAGTDEDFSLDKKIFAPELAECFLTELCFDDHPDVRGRAAAVISYIPDPRSTPVLLTLLHDPEWFVALHTVRALAKRKYLPQLPELVRQLNHQSWMVREAAVRTVLSFGKVGLDQLSVHFLESPDKYCREQIADEFQRAGVIPVLLKEYVAETEGRATFVIEQLVNLGKTSYMVGVVAGARDPGQREKFLRHVGGREDPQIRAWVKEVAARGSDPELQSLAKSVLAGS